jgi:hypothetical protein
MMLKSTGCPTLEGNTIMTQNDAGFFEQKNNKKKHRKNKTKQKTTTCPTKTKKHKTKLLITQIK